MLTFIQEITIWIVPVLFAITLHEAAHAWIASRCGDTTAQALGRLSINPLKHIDPIGTVLIPILVAFLSGFQFIFGWAKPVPINWRLLRKPRRDMALVAAAGPIANIIMALVWAFCAKLGSLLGPDKSPIALYMLLTGEAGILINLVLGFLNLIPLLPLDGGRVVLSLLSPKLATYYAKLESFGFLIVIALLFSGILGRLITPPISWAIYTIHTLFNLN